MPCKYNSILHDCTQREALKEEKLLQINQCYGSKLSCSTVYVYQLQPIYTQVLILMSCTPLKMFEKMFSDIKLWAFNSL